MTNFYSKNLMIISFKKHYQSSLKILFLVGILTINMTIQARPPSNLEATQTIKKQSTNTIQKSNDCTPATSYFELNINNIRTRINVGGDKWWDLQNGPKYEVPKLPLGSTQVAVHALFAGSIWIGGIDETGQLKLAAQTYRQTGNDFWAGPLDDNGEVSAEICNQFDRAWEVTSTDIDEYLQKWDAAEGTLAITDIPTSLLQWPGRNNPHFSDFELPTDKNLAPFWDHNADGVYNPTQGDYPVMNEAIERVYPDQMFWWAFNDKGNVHTETGGEAIGIEIGALAFAFATADELNNMTFYKYKVQNLSSQRLDSVYLGHWTDPDLGQYNDDFVGCVPEESLGIVYNGSTVDGEYGENPPMVAIDILEGPKRQIAMDTTTQTPIWERMGMSTFLYYNGDGGSTQGNPSRAEHYYNLLTGHWKRGEPITIGGNGANEGADTTTFMFPDDPKLPLPAWSECSENNTPADRRFVQSMGPFTLMPGGINDMTVNVIWTDEIRDYPCPSFDPIIRISRKVQARFDNQFALKRGPDAPDLTISHFNRGLTIELSNKADSNNAQEDYVEKDPELAAQGFENSSYTFQGYRIYQLADASVSPEEYHDPSRAREVVVVDIIDQITAITNYTYNKTTKEIVKDKAVLGSDSGISHTFEVTKDLFADAGDDALINQQEYYYSAIAYAHNAHTPYNAFNPDPTAQLEPYLESSRNVQVYIGKPNYAIGFEEENELGATSIYPNPFYRSSGGNAQLTNLPKDGIIHLFSAEGREVQTIQYTSQSTLYLQSYLDKMTMTTGMYFIQVSLPESQQTRTFKWYYIAD